jgi:hypothetical protein
MRAAAFVILGALAACDPGGSYHVPGGKEVMADGRRFDIVGPSNTSLRANAHWFTGSVDIELAITNTGTTALLVEPDKLRLADRVGPLQFVRQRLRCNDQEAHDSVTLKPGETCDASGSFSVHVDRDRLSSLTLDLDGVTREGVSVPVLVKFELDR